MARLSTAAPHPFAHLASHNPDGRLPPHDNRPATNSAPRQLGAFTSMANEAYQPASAAMSSSESGLAISDMTSC